MKKTFELENLDCANCAARMENLIAKIPNVISVSISFMAQKLVLEIADDNFSQILPSVRQAIAQIDSDCTLLE